MKNIILCFVEDMKDSNSLNEYIEHLDSLDYEVHIYQDSLKCKIQPHDVLRELDSLNSENKDNFLFLTNVKNLFYLVYRLYHQIFEQFFYFSETNELEGSFDGVYEQLLRIPIKQEEELYKSIYTNDINCLEYLQSQSIILLSSMSNHDKEMMPKRRLIQKYYYIQKGYYLFEPIKSVNKVLVDEQENVKQIYSNTEYVFYFNEEIPLHIFHQLENNFLELVKEFHPYFESIERYLNKEPFYRRQMLLSILKDWDDIDGERRPREAILLLSFLAYYTKESLFYEKLLEITVNSDSLLKEERNYIYQQIKTITFERPYVSTPFIGKRQSEIYQLVYHEFEESFQNKLQQIPREDRNKDLIIIMVYQFLLEKHPPTHTTLERAYNLSKYMNKKVIIINTHENITPYGRISFFHSAIGNYLNDHNSTSEVKYKDMLIPFWQVAGPMPSREAIDEVLSFIKEVKPYFILNIGGSSIAADLCGKLVPELSMGVVFSNLPRTIGNISVIGRKINENEWENLSLSGYEPDNIIESTFTFELSAQKSVVSRRMLSLPEDKFLLIVVGKRLNDDITDEYIEHIEKTFCCETHLVLAGEFTNYKIMCERHPLFKEHSTSLGYYPDILALMEVCDLYVNPKRMGGGFSIAEAFYKGIPGVTINYGDIASAAGNAFCVNSYEDLVDTIIRYCKDKEFYQRMSRKAKERAAILIDGKKALEEILEKAEKSKFFF